MAGQEKRVCPRFPIRDARVGVVVKTIRTFLTRAKRGHQPLLDIGMRGLRVVTKEHLAKLNKAMFDLVEIKAVI